MSDIHRCDPNWQPGWSPAYLGDRGWMFVSCCGGHGQTMRARVAIHGQLDCEDFWHYSATCEPSDTGSMLSLRVRDSQEFVGVLRAILLRGVVITHAVLEAGPDVTVERPSLADPWLAARP
jgi:hypothetical protein